MKVDFEIHHIADRPGYLMKLLGATDGSESTDKTSTFIETLSSSANGIGLVIGTRTRAVLPIHDTISDTERDQARPRRNLFSGNAAPNPTFLYESAEIFEAIVSLDLGTPRRMNFSDSVALLKIVSFASELAAIVGRAPLLSVQAPVQLPPRAKSRDQSIRSREEAVPPHSSSAAVRFAIALQKPSARLRIQLADRLRAYCSERGLGLWLGDIRSGSRPGNWFQVCSLSESDYEQHFVDTPAEEVTVSVPVTFVGPARIGSTYAISSYLLSLSRPMGIVACSVTSIDDLAFLHFQLSVKGLAISDLIEAGRSLARTNLNQPPEAVINEVVKRLSNGLEEASHRELGLDLAIRAWDYKTYLGSVFPYLPPSKRRRMAIWFSWQSVRSSSGLSGPLLSLYRAFAELNIPLADVHRPGGWENAPNIEYLICREVANGVLRGKGKISLPKDAIDSNFGQPGLDSPAADFCVRLEAAWKAEADLSEPFGVLELTVSWQESWLGHWSSAP
jgi:hypothetical protein